MDETRETKRGKITFGKVFKYLLLAASAAVYLVFFARFFVSCDAEIADDFYLDPESAEIFSDLDRDLPFYHYQPESWTSEDGYVQITNIYYLEQTGDLQMTVRSRDEIYEKENGEYPFEFKIRVVGEDELESEQTPVRVTETRMGYTYVRLCAENVVSDHGEVVEVELETYDEQGNSVITTDTEIKGGTEVFLDILDSETHERLFTFTVAGKNSNRARIRRSTVDLVVTD